MHAQEILLRSALWQRGAAQFTVVASITPPAKSYPFTIGFYLIFLLPVANTLGSASNVAQGRAFQSNKANGRTRITCPH